MADKNLEDRVYKRIRLHGREEFQTLASAFSLDLDLVREVCAALQQKGLVELVSGTAIARKWWAEEHVELFLNPSWLEEKEFRVYCRGLDSLAEQISEEGIEAIRPLAHETSIVIILTSAALTVGGLLTKKFFEKLGEKLSEFIAKALLKSDAMKVEVKGTKQLVDGTTLSFSVSGDKVPDIIKSFDQLSAKIGELESDVERNQRLRQLSDSAEGWQISIK